MMRFGLILIAAVTGSLAAAGPLAALDGPYHGTFTAQEIKFNNLVGVLDIEVGGVDGSSIAVDITGRPEELEEITVLVRSNRLVIDSSRHHYRIHGDYEDYVQIRVKVPAGIALDIDSFIGEAEIGDIRGPLKIDANSLDAVIGDVKSAEIDISGSGDIDIGDIEGDLDLEISGSGDFQARSAASAQVDISGAGDVVLGPVRGGLEAGIAGSGDIEAASVNGPVKIDIAGSGNIVINGGEANPLKVNILGSGDFALDGNAVDPDISVFGSGSVTLKSYSGRLTSKGQSNLTVGE